MPKIPVYDRQFDRQSVDLGAPKQSFDTNIAMFGGGDAAGLKSLGGGMADVGTVMLATANRMKKEEDETAVLDAYRRYHDAVGMQLYGDGSPETGLFNRSGQGAIGATKEAKDAFERARQEIAGTLKNPEQQRMFGLKADTLASESMLSVARHEGGQRKAALAEGYKAVAKKENSYALLNFTDPGLVNAALGRMDESARAAARLSGLDPEATDSMVSALKSDTLKNVAMRHIENGNFTTVQELLKDERLSGDDAAAVEKSFKTASDRAKSYGLFQQAMGQEDPIGWLREQDIDPLILEQAESRTKAEIQWKRSEQKEAEAIAARNAEDSLVKALESKDLNAAQRIIEDAPAGLRKEFTAYRDAKLSGKDIEDDPAEKWKWTQMLADDPQKFREEWNSPAMIAKLSPSTREKFDNAYIALGKKGAADPVIDEIQSDADLIAETARRLDIETRPSEMSDADEEKLAALNRYYARIVRIAMGDKKNQKLTTDEKQKLVDEHILRKGKIKGSGKWPWSPDWEKKSKFEAMYEGKDFYIDVESDPVGYARKQAQAQGVPDDIVEGMIRTESSLRKNAVSHRGAKGFMQLMPEAAAEMGVDRDDPEQNVAGGVKYFKKQIDMFRSMPEVPENHVIKLALMAYNWGPTATKNWYLAGADQSKVPAETVDYVKKVMLYKR